MRRPISMVSPIFLLSACIISGAAGMSYYSTVNGRNEIIIGNHQISVVTQPVPKLYIDGTKVDLSQVEIIKKGDDYEIYGNFKDVPGLSVKFYDNGGYTVYYENNGVVSKFGSLSPEEQQQLNDQMNATFQTINNQMAQVQQQIQSMMQGLSNMFSNPRWPFVR